LSSQTPYLNTTDIAILTSSQIATFNSSGITGLTSSAIIAMTTVQVKALTSLQLSYIQSKYLQTEDIIVFSSLQVIGLINNNFNSILNNINLPQSGIIKTGQVIIKSSQIFIYNSIQTPNILATDITPTSITNRIAEQQIINTTLELSSLTSLQIIALTSSQVTSINNTYLYNVPTVLNNILTVQIEYTNTNQIVNYLTTSGNIYPRLINMYGNNKYYDTTSGVLVTTSGTISGDLFLYYAYFSSVNANNNIPINVGLYPSLITYSSQTVTNVTSNLLLWLNFSF
jgi:hypothetical protein